MFSTNCHVAKTCCARFYGSVPGGCFITTGKGLRSFQTPLEQIKVEPIPDDSPVSHPPKKPKI